MPELFSKLEERLRHAETTHDRVDALNELAEHNRTVSDRETRRLADEALKLAEADSYIKGIADSQNNLAWCDVLAGRQESALERVLKVTEMVRDDDTLAPTMGKSLAIQGLIYLHVGDLPQALETLFKALEYARDDSVINLRGGITNDIGIVYLETEDYPRALAQFSESLALFETQPDLAYRSLVPLINISCVYIEQGDYDQAEVYARKALAVCDAHDAQGGRGSALANLGEIQHKRGEFDAAWASYNNALAIARETEDYSLLVSTLCSMGELKLDQGDPSAALVYLDEAYKAAQADNALLFMAKAQEMLSRAYEAQGDLKQALTMHKAYFETKQKVFGHANDARLKTIQTGYEVEAAQHEQEILRLRNAALEREIAEGKQASAERIARERLQIELESEHKLNAIKSRVMVRIAHEFRTPLSVILTTTQLLTRYFERISQEERQHYEAVIRDEVQRLADMLDDITVVLRTAGNSTVPFHPLRIDLMQACTTTLQEYISERPEARRVTMAFDMEPQTGMLDLGVLKCMLSGVLDNALKFSPDDEPVEIRVRRDYNDLIITVSDYGIGVLVEDYENIFLPFHRCSNVGEVQGMGLGLAIVKDCVERHNGTIRVNSLLGECTTVMMRIDVGPSMAINAAREGEVMVS